MRQSVCGRMCLSCTYGYAMAAGELQHAQRGGECPFPSIHATLITAGDSTRGIFRIQVVLDGRRDDPLPPQPPHQ